MWTTAVALALLAGLGVAVLAAYGSPQWARGTRALRAALSPSAGTTSTSAVDFRELANLPAPVQRYFHQVLPHGAPLIAAVRLQQAGEFNLSATGHRWKPFYSDQLVRIHPPGFDWDARIRIIPGVPVCVHDAYVSGEGILRAAVLGLFTVASIQGKGQIARDELMRFLAEAVWYPTVLLPGQGVRWTEVHAQAASAELTDGEVSVKLIFRFNAQGLIESVEAESRGRMVGKRVVPTPWRGRYWDYQRRSGILVPLQGEVAWELPGGIHPYWRGRITGIEYQFSTSD